MRFCRDIPRPIGQICLRRDMDNKRMVGWPLLGLVDFGYGLCAFGVGAQTINRLGRQRYQATVVQNTGGMVNRACHIVHGNGLRHVVGFNPGLPGSPLGITWYRYTVNNSQDRTVRRPNLRITSRARSLACSMVAPTTLICPALRPGRGSSLP